MTKTPECSVAGGDGFAGGILLANNYLEWKEGFMHQISFTNVKNGLL